MTAGHIAPSYISQRRRKYDAPRQRANKKTDSEYFYGGAITNTN